MAESLQALYEEQSPYPPQPDRMRSGHLNTYVRGQGNYPASAFVADKSEPGGFRTKRVSKGQIKLTSQQMDKKYKQKVTTSSSEVIGELRNDATYSGYVIGHKTEDPHQVSFHATTGWPNADDSVATAIPAINASVEKAINDFLKQLKGA
jgi:hypothetical protein